jgi:hypothetical protein
MMLKLLMSVTSSLSDMLFPLPKFQSRFRTSMVIEDLRPGTGTSKLAVVVTARVWVVNECIAILD